MDMERSIEFLVSAQARMEERFSRFEDRMGRMETSFESMKEMLREVLVVQREQGRVLTRLEGSLERLEARLRG